MSEGGKHGAMACYAHHCSLDNHHCRRCSSMTLLGRRYLQIMSLSLYAPSLCMLVLGVCVVQCSSPPPSCTQWEHPSLVVVVYDVTNEQSFKSCAKWLERVRAQKPEQPFPGVTHMRTRTHTHTHTHTCTDHWCALCRCAGGQQGRPPCSASGGRERRKGLCSRQGTAIL